MITRTYYAHGQIYRLHSRRERIPALANIAEGIRINLDGIGHLLQDSKLQVPTYQRSYAWTDKNVTQLFKDLGTAIAEGESEYFLGSVVLIGAATDRPSVVGSSALPPLQFCWQRSGIISNRKVTLEGLTKLRATSCSKRISEPRNKRRS